MFTRPLDARLPVQLLRAAFPSCFVNLRVDELGDFFFVKGATQEVADADGAVLSLLKGAQVQTREQVFLYGGHFNRVGRHFRSSCAVLTRLP
jgi:hypothetical protein